jgi:hypothetical protein
MAEAELAEFAERFEMVLEDLAVLPADRVVADGFGLLPDLIASVSPDRSRAIFLLPTPEFRDWALAQRGWVAREGTSNPVRARANRLVRDAMLTDHVRTRALALGFATIDVDGTRTLADVVADVASHFRLGH